MSNAPQAPGKEDEFEPRLSEYLDGSLTPEARDEVDRHLETCAHCREALAGLRETMHALSGLNRVAAPDHFDREVAETIRRRSRGRFFGRKALGDRVPFELLAVLALLLGLALYFFLRQSETGSLSPFDREPARPAIHQDARDVVPRP